MYGQSKSGIGYQKNYFVDRTSIRLLGIHSKACYALAEIGSRSCRTSKVHSA